LVGDNAAGKSTLMKILAGVLRPDTGQIFIEDRPESFKSPRDARSMGIEMVYQDFALCKNMWIAGNVFMAREIVREIIGRTFSVLDKKQMADRSRKILEEQKVSIGSCKKRAGELSGGQQQSVAIARALGFNARIVIMDEPTASLGVKQASRLLEIAQSLPQKGISAIYISHRMQDIFSICHRVMVLKTGEKVGDFRIKEVSVDEIVRLMILGKQGNGVETNSIR
ncbi:MAG: ATP-binding cassette domain-containing protein, partial [Atribacterota bacterium]